MTQPTQPISPLRQRMIEDMNLRKLAPKTRPVISVLLRSWPIIWITHRIQPLPKTCASSSCT